MGLQVQKKKKKRFPKNLTVFNKLHENPFFFKKKKKNLKKKNFSVETFFFYHMIIKEELNGG